MKARSFVLALAVALAACATVRMDRLFDSVRFIHAMSETQSRISHVAGTAVLLGVEKGLGSVLLTAAHVVEGANIATLEDDADKEFLGLVIYRDAKRDLALVYAPELEGVPAVFAKETPSRGAAVVALGASMYHPFGMIVTHGMVSSRLGPCPSGIKAGCWLADFPSGPGSSGGPVFDSDGRLVGIDVAGHTGLPHVALVVDVQMIIEFLRDAGIAAQKKSEPGLPKPV